MSEHSIEGIRLNIEQGREGLFYGTSPDERGLLVAGKTEEAVIDKTPRALAELRSAALESALQAWRME